MKNGMNSGKPQLEKKYLKLDFSDHLISLMARAA